MIKFLDLQKLNKSYEADFVKVHQEFLQSGRYILGNQVAQFEKNFADYCGTKYCIGVANGLDALILILRGYIEIGKLQKGDEVIVPANTYIASILAIIEAGLEPVFVEPDKETFNISIEGIKEAITWKTRVIMPVHLYGQLANMNAINTLAKEQNLIVVEDAAQAHGASNNKGIRAGNLGYAAGFSFYPSKNLGALGDGGAITTNDDKLAAIVMKMRNYGCSSKYVNDVKGVNSRLDEVQAMYLNIKLKDLDSQNKKRVEIAKKYLDNISTHKIKLPQYSGDDDHVFHQFVVRVENRDNFINYLKENNVETLIHYPIPPHKQKALSEYNHFSFPNTETIHEQVVSIPLNPILLDNEVNTIIELLNTY
jgi:dTDP-4-amino-4,6-dideoxygalactose transaminase